MVTGGDSCSRGNGFISQHRIQDGHFNICCENSIVCLKRPKNNEKETGDGTFKKN